MKKFELSFILLLHRTFCVKIQLYLYRISAYTRHTNNILHVAGKYAQKFVRGHYSVARGEHARSFENWELSLGDFPVLGSVHATTEKFENAALFLRLGLPSTLIRHENEAFRKRSSNRRNLKTQLYF